MSNTDDIPTKGEWLGMVTKHFPAVNSDEETMDILWNLTAFPFAGRNREGFAHYDRQLAELSVKAGGDVEKAFAISDAETEQAMRLTR